MEFDEIYIHVDEDGIDYLYEEDIDEIKEYLNFLVTKECSNFWKLYFIPRSQINKWYQLVKTSLKLTSNNLLVFNVEQKDVSGNIISNQNFHINKIELEGDSIEDYILNLYVDIEVEYDFYSNRFICTNSYGPPKNLFYCNKTDIENCIYPPSYDEREHDYQYLNEIPPRYEHIYN